MTAEEKMDYLEDALVGMCFGRYGCGVCSFFDTTDKTGDGCRCGIRDNQGRIPDHKEWNMREALELKKQHEPIFPKSIRESIMNHFMRCE